MAAHIYVSISSHGRGHTAQASAVVNALWKRDPNLVVTLCTKVPGEDLESFFDKDFNDRDFRLIDESDDVGMCQSGLDIQVKETADRYAEFHEKWDERVKCKTDLLQSLEVDLVLTNVAYIPLAAAAAVKIPAVAFCCFNWADLYWHFCKKQVRSKEIRDQIKDAYRKADKFLLTEPYMPIKWLGKSQRHVIGPIAREGKKSRAKLRKTLSVPKEQRIVLVAFGGSGDLEGLAQDLPRDAKTSWIVQGPAPADRSDVTSQNDLSLPFPNILRSVDAVITKPGYGTFVEAACYGTPVVYVRRRNWPEEPYLIDWMRKHAPCIEIDRCRIKNEEILRSVSKVLGPEAWNGLCKSRRPKPTGAEEAADIIGEHYLGSPD